MPDAVACPRDPGTTTRLRCYRCEAVICPDCMTPGATGNLCPDCVRADRKSAPTVKRVGPGAGVPPVTRVFLGLIMLVFLVTIPLGGLTGTTSLHVRFGFQALAFAQGDWYRIFTSELLHFGLLHLAFNAYGLWILGPMLEDRLGGWRFLLLILAASAGAGAGSAIVSPGALSAGASGALFGMLGAGVVLERRRGARRLMDSQIGVWLLFGIAFTFAVPGISVGGHLGGLVGGAIAGTILFALDRAEVRWQGIAGAVAVIVVGIAVARVASEAELTRRICASLTQAAAAQFGC